MCLSKVLIIILMQRKYYKRRKNRRYDTDGAIFSIKTTEHMDFLVFHKSKEYSKNYISSPKLGGTDTDILFLLVLAL